MRKTVGLAALAVGFLMSAGALADSDAPRSSYTYVRDMSGDVSVDSRLNGRVEARRNMPISVGDEIVVADAGRAEIGLADGNLLHIGGRTRARFESIYAQQGEEDDFSAIKLREGSVILSAVAANEDRIPRIDTDDATVYLSTGARARVNVDPRRGTVVIARAGSIEVRTRDGSSNLRAGQYLMIRDGEEPEIERGSFSRDRFDVWATERLASVSETRSASARYVDDQYQSDVAALDGYGDWNYNDTTTSYVWSPRVSADWSPYSYGSWYYTPVGLTWWSNDPWGWYPFHYGNWFFDASWRRWCWAPGSIYSPAWVYWAHTPSYVGWCPIGYYSFFSPWYDNYYRRWGWSRPNLYLSIRGTFDSRRIDFRGWNFVGAGSFTTAARMEVIPGSRIADRLGPQVAISSRPIVVNARQGAAREAIREYVREAPRLIERTASADSGRLAPILARERTLPPASVEALRDRAVIAERGRLTGSAAADVAPRGALVERGRTAAETGRRKPTTLDRGRALNEVRAPADAARAPRSLNREDAATWRGRSNESIPPRPVERPQTRLETRPDARLETRPDARVIAPSSGAEGWRSRGRTLERSEIREQEAPSRDSAPRERAAPSNDWRTRSLERRPSDDWRPRSDVPPARRVIEGAVPGRRPDTVREEQPQRREAPAQEWRGRERVDPPRREYRPEYRREQSQPVPRSERAPVYAPRVERAPAYSPPPPRAERAPVYSAPPPPRAESHRSAPPPPPRDHGRKQ